MPNLRRWLTENGQIPEDILPRMAKSRKMTYYRDLLNSGLRQAGIGQAPKHLSPNLQTFKELRNQIPRSRFLGSLNVYKFWPCCHRQVNLLNFNRGFDETSSLKSSSGDIRFRLVASRNFKEFWNRLSRILKVRRQFFEPTFTLISIDRDNFNNICLYSIPLCTW